MEYLVQGQDVAQTNAIVSFVVQLYYSLIRLDALIMERNCSCSYGGAIFVVLNHGVENHVSIEIYQTS